MTTNTYRGKDISVLNTAMHIYIPETDGVPYGDYPMSYPRWYQPNENVPFGPQSGEPCFIRTENKMPDSTFKQGYVWGPGDKGWGYYHLLTKSCWKTLYARVLNGRVTVSGEEGCCSCFEPTDPRTVLPKPTTGLTRDDMDDLRVLFHGRSVATAANDGVARADQLADGRNTAQGQFMMEQGFAVEDAVKINKGIQNQTIKR